MKKLVSMVMGLAAAAAFAIPMPEVQVLNFSIQGNETYADGSPLADGECYALVWSEGVFEGINGDGTAKGDGDEVIYIGQIVKGADVSFQIKDGFKNSGSFDVWILDTRVFENGAVKSIGKASNGKVTISHAAKATNAPVQVAGSQGAPTAIGGVEGGAVIAAPTVDPANIPPLKFTSIKLDGDFVVMEAEDTVPGVNYTTVADGKEAGITTATGSKIILIRPKQGDSAIIRGLAK